MSARTVALVLSLAATLAGQRAAPPAPPPPAHPRPLAIPARDEAGTRQLAQSFAQGENWALKAIVLLSYGPNVHPVAAEVLVAALRDRDPRLPVYAVETLRRMEDRALRCVLTKPLVEELIVRQLHHKNRLYVERVADVLAHGLPDSGVKDRRGYDEWWREHAKDYAPDPWLPPPPARSEPGRTVAGVVERAFDLKDAGLDLAIVLDSTGSMQPVIDTARDAIEDLVALLVGVAPKLRLGLVHYKDLDDFHDGAQLLVPMTKDQKVVHDKLAHLVAGGGGDAPERVEKGIEFALGKEMGWNKDANRLLLVIGDAPPHDESMTDLLAMVKRAHDQPFANGKAPVTGGTKGKLRPFVTSCIATNMAAKPAFDSIATAGGGTSVLLEVPSGPPAGGKAAAAPAAQAGNERRAVQQVVENVLVLSFGPTHRPVLHEFTTVFFEYRDAGLIQ